MTLFALTRIDANRGDVGRNIEAKLGGGRDWTEILRGKQSESGNKEENKGEMRNLCEKIEMFALYITTS